MSKKIVFFFILLFSVGVFIGGLISYFKAGLISNKKIVKKESPRAPKQNKSNQVTVQSTSIFVPYWATFDDTFDVSKYDSVIYFGITPSYPGINTSEPGYANIEKFVSAVPDGKKTQLTLRMVDTEQNFSILKNRQNWDSIADESISIANKYKFDGVVLDLEISALAFSDLKAQVSDFVQYFYSKTKGQNLHFTVLLYGDTIYRSRPYDVARIAANADEIMVMAYDYHKSRGEPGPNFPLTGNATYGYDFTQMTKDFKKFVPANKLRVIFGMYGYDWEVDEHKRPYTAAKSLSLNDVRSKFLDNCTFKNCLVRRDQQSTETEVNYVESAAYVLHIVWFEDEQSVAAKKSLLEKAGIDKIGYWAYGYF